MNMGERDRDKESNMKQAWEAGWNRAKEQERKYITVEKRGLALCIMGNQEV